MASSNHVTVSLGLVALGIEAHSNCRQYQSNGSNKAGGYQLQTFNNPGVSLANSLPGAWSRWNANSPRPAKAIIEPSRKMTPDAGGKNNSQRTHSGNQNIHAGTWNPRENDCAEWIAELLTVMLPKNHRLIISPLAAVTCSACPPTRTKPSVTAKKTMRREVPPFQW